VILSPFRITKQFIEIAMFIQYYLLTLYTSDDNTARGAFGRVRENKYMPISHIIQLLIIVFICTIFLIELDSGY
jgi:uncharacterized phage infection (PIP) family protein YhgE